MSETITPPQHEDGEREDNPTTNLNVVLKRVGGQALDAAASTLLGKQPGRRRSGEEKWGTGSSSQPAEHDAHSAWDKKIDAIEEHLLGEGGHSRRERADYTIYQAPDNTPPESANKESAGTYEGKRRSGNFSD